MRIRSAAVFVLAATALAISAFGCSKKSSSDNGNSSNSSTDIFGDSSEFDSEFGKVKDADEGPVLYISNTRVKAGGVAEVTVSVKDTGAGWSLCGLHVVFPEELEAVLENEEERELKITQGSAADGSVGVLGKLWRDNLPDMLLENHMGSVFFSTMFGGTKGSDGDIATLYFNVPSDANPGTVYNFDFYYSNTELAQDMFKNAANDPEYEKYAFTHWQGGTVTVE